MDMSERLARSTTSGANETVSGSGRHSFWITAVGGFVLGVVTVLLVLLLARRIGYQEPDLDTRPAAANSAQADK